MQHLLSYFLILSVSLINVTESAVAQCDWKNYKKCDWTAITKDQCENRCHPCLNSESKWGGPGFPKCQRTIDGKKCYYVDNDIRHDCVELDRPSGTRVETCKVKPWCTYKDCHDDNCRPCNYALAVKDIDKDWCFIDGDGACRYEEWTDKTKTIKQLNNCFKLPTPKFLCNTTDGDTLIFVNDTKSIHNASTYCLETYDTDIASIYKSEIVEAISLMTEVGTILQVKAWIGLINTYYGGWFEWDDDSCCDNVDGSCIDDWWADKKPLKNGTFYVNMNQDGNINNDLEGDQLLPFFCNCPTKEIDECPILISSTTIRRLLAYILN